MVGRRRRGRRNFRGWPLGFRGSRLGIGGGGVWGRRRRERAGAQLWRCRWANWEWVWTFDIERKAGPRRIAKSATLAREENGSEAALKRNRKSKPGALKCGISLVSLLRRDQGEVEQTAGSC